MMKYLCAFVALYVLTAVGASAYNEEDLQTLLADGDCASCDLGGADLSGADLSGANLSSTNLSGANLGGTILKFANLKGAILEGANLTFANLADADLSGAEHMTPLLSDGAILCNTTMPDGSIDSSSC